MKKTHLLLIVIFVGLTLALSACVPGPRVTGAPGVTLGEDMAYVGYANFVYALNSDSGAIEWQYPEERDNQIVFYSQPLVADDGVFVGDLANNFYKLDRETGDMVWTFSGSKGYFIGKAAENDGVVFAPSNDGTLYALDSSGDLLWGFTTGHYLWAQPLIANNTIYQASMDHTLYALTLGGEEKWATELGGAIVNAPVISEDGSVLYAGSLGNEIVAVDADSGDILWRYETEESVWGAPLLHDGSLYFADSGGNLYAISDDGGTALWQTEYQGAVLGGLTLIDDGFALATEQGVVKAFDFDGSPRWESTLEGEIYQSPVVHGENLMVGTINGDKLVYAFNLSGVQLWSMSPEN
jgi:outer membrane protein assembly factor BamB